MTTEIAKKDTAGSIVSKMQGQFAKVLPKIITPERYCRIMLTALNKDKHLMAAISDPRNQASVLSAFMRCAEMGLEPDGRRAAIVCYKRGNTGMYDVTLIPMFQGLAELAMRSGEISTIHAEKVCDNDEFEWNLGRVVKHVPNWKEDRGKAYLYYCHVVFKDGAIKDETMSKLEVEEIMKRSSAYQGAKRYNKSCPWMTDFEEMAKKTVFRRCSKWLPLSPELRSAIEADDADYVDTAGAIHHSADDKFAQSVGVTSEPAVDAEVIHESEDVQGDNAQGGSGKADLFQEETKGEQ